MQHFYMAIAFLFCHFVSHAQSATYGFIGKISLEERQSLETKAQDLPGILSIKCRYKEDSERGELLIDLPEAGKSTRAEDDAQTFSPADLKQLLLEFHLTPVDYILLNK
ncbi:MAG: hypothetical protein A3D92_11075 [Bacteroidetes bacterium RIFCSPHIGHO2_02_FULL_44_7]|nr:MAG: hypothetical protein A3D92_11075 [Bacteroidetes bacterium RIFCSPHIGHO2_02_FULL_44_7]